MKLKRHLMAEHDGEVELFASKAEFNRIMGRKSSSVVVCDGVTRNAGRTCIVVEGELDDEHNSRARNVGRVLPPLYGILKAGTMEYVCECVSIKDAQIVLGMSNTQVRCMLDNYAKGDGFYIYTIGKKKRLLDALKKRRMSYDNDVISEYHDEKSINGQTYAFMPSRIDNGQLCIRCCASPICPNENLKCRDYEREDKLNGYWRCITKYQ